MIKVLMVDDEKLALDYLENIISWEYYGFQVVGVTTDTEQALNLYRKHHPELIISDIKMPGMNGIDFAQAIRDMDKHSHILFLSGYRDFNYVKQAIRLGIDDYLLKSDVDEEVFLKKILQLKETIEKERSKNQYTTGIILEELFRKNIEETHYKDMLDENEYIRIHKKYFYMIFTAKGAPRFVYEFIHPQNEEPEFSELDLKHICNEEADMQEMRVLSFFGIGHEEYLGIFEMGNNLISQMEMNHQLYQLAVRIFSRLNKNTECQFCIFYYAKGLSVRQFGRFFQKNKEQLLLRYVKLKAQIIEFAEGNAVKKTEENGTPSVTTDEIYKSVKNAAMEQIQKYINILKISVQQEDYYTYLWYLHNMLEAMSKFETSLVGEKSGRQFLLSESHSDYNPSNPEDIIVFLQYKLEQIHTISNEYRENTYSSVILDALDYIQKNCAQAELSTNTIAKQVNLSSSWLSTKFKEEVGVGISDYINSIRIQMAKQMFDQQDYMIYEVAEKLGFASSQYFSKIFKQYAGVTPNEYKRNIGQ